MAGRAPMDVRHPLRTPTGTLVAAALILLIVTAVTGALRGLDVVSVSADSLHGPAGTRGWLTLGVLAIAMLLFPGDDAPGAAATALLAWIPTGAMTVFVLASWSERTPGRDLAAYVALLATLGFAVGLLPRIRRAAVVTVPQLGVLAGLAILAAGLALDPVVDVNDIGEADWVPFRVAGARSPSIVVFSVLVGSALAERRLVARPAAATADMWGLTQVLLFVAGWLTLLVGTAADSLNLLVSNALFHAIAVAVFLARVAPRLTPAHWAMSDRWFAAMVLYLSAHVGLLGHVALGVSGKYYLELAQVPTWLTFAVDHVVFVGVIGNGLLGLAFGSGPSEASARTEKAAFWAMNLGFIAFVFGLASETTVGTRAGAAVMGTGIVTGAVACLNRFREPVAAP